MNTWLDRTMPNSPESALRRRKKALATLAGFAVAMTSIIGIPRLNDESRISQDIAIADHNDEKPSAQADGDIFISAESPEQFKGELDVSSITLYDNPYKEDEGPTFRSSPDTGILGLSNKIVTLPKSIDRLETPSGINEICTEETYRTIAGDVLKRCWLEFSTADAIDSISDLNSQGQYDRVLELLGTTDPNGSTYVASDITSINS